MPQIRYNKKRASTVSSKGDEQVFSKEDQKSPLLFAECDPAKNFRSTSPKSRDTKIQTYTDMKFKSDKLS